MRIRSRLLALALSGLMLPLAGCHEKEVPVAAPRVVAVINPIPVAGAVSDAYPGTVRARVESALSFRVGGKIVERHVEIGQHVHKGAVLAVLDPVDAKLNVDASVATVKAAEADAKLAMSELRRYEDLLKKGFVSQSLVDLRHSESDAAQARLEQARSQLAVIRNQAGYTTLVADADGTVTELLAEAGQVVAAGQAVVNFARDGEREVRINVPEGAAVTQIGEAPQLFVMLWGAPEKRYQARLRELSTAADPVLRTHEARITIVDTDDAVRLGMSASVLVGTAATQPMFRVPLTAVTALHDQATVWRVQGDPATVQPLTVKVLQYLDTEAVIAGDLSVQDRLASAGVHLLIPDMPVKAIDRRAPVAL